MSYTIKKSDGSTLVTIPDGNVDNTSDLTLIGKNFTGFGEILNDNLIKLLENFAGVDPPLRPLIGELWYNKSDNRLMVYSPTGWKSPSGPIVQPTEPIAFTTGDLWIDSSEQKLYFWDGSSLNDASKVWKKSQGKTGFIPETLADASGNPRVVLNLYVNDVRFGIFAAQAFTPSPAITGFTTLVKGFNTNSTASSFVFDTTVTNSQNLLGVSPDNYVLTRSNSGFSEMANELRIISDNGITISNNGAVKLKMSGTGSTEFVIANTNNNGNIRMQTTNADGVGNALWVDSQLKRVGIFTTAKPEQTLDIGGSLRVQGNLIVEGDNFTVNVGTVKVEDKNIELASTISPTDILADGAGITIKGTTDKTLTYNDSFKSLDSSEHFRVISGKSYYVGSSQVLTGNSLGSSITSAPGLTSIGTLTSLNVAGISISSNQISSSASNTDIKISPNGTGNISVIGSKRITGLGNPVNLQDAATKYYVDGAISTGQPLSITLIDNGLEDINGLGIDNYTILILTDIYPPSVSYEGKEAYVHYQHINFNGYNVQRYLKKFTISGTGHWIFAEDLTSSV
jgi:hypothetical protein